MATAAAGLTLAIGAPLIASTGLMIGGILLDADHVLDYFIFAEEKNFTPREVYHYHRGLKYQKVLTLFHAYEWLLAALLAAQFTASAFLWGIFAGMALHLGLDVIFNGWLHRYPLCHYSLLFRLIKRLDVGLLEKREVLRPRFR